MAHPIYAWGTMQDTFLNGPLGIGNASSQPLTPSLVSLSGVDVIQIAATGPNTYFLTSGGLVYACGSNSQTNGGFLGIGSSDSSTHPTPVQITGLPSTIVSLSAGANAVLALASNGDLWGWGINIHGELGLGTTSTHTSPVLLHTGVSAAHTGALFSIIRLATGQVLTAGSNSQGSTGQGSFSGNSTSWTAISATDTVVDIAAVDTLSFIILADGSVKASGYGPYGQGGYNVFSASLNEVNVHTAVPGLSSIVQISGTVFTTYFLDSSGAIHFYGVNSANGASGTGSTATFRRGTVSGDVPATVSMPVTCASLCFNDAGNTQGPSDNPLPSMGAVGVDGLLYTWGFGLTSPPALGGIMGSGSDVQANPTPVSLNGLTSVVHAAISYAGVWAAEGVVLSPTGVASNWAAVIG